MNRIHFMLGLVLAGGLILWLVLLQSRLTTSESRLAELEARYQEVAAAHQQARETISSLHRELSLLQALSAGSAGKSRTPGTTIPAETGAGSGEPRDRRGPTGAPSSLLTPWNLPAEVADGISKRFGQVELAEVQPSVQKGQQVFVVRGTTGDARPFGAVFGADGTILSSKAEVAPDAVPPSVSTAFREIGGEATVQKARELYSSDGQLEYSLSGLSQDGRKVSLNVSAEGRINSGEVQTFVSQLPEPVGNTLAQTVLNRSPSSAVQVFGDKGTFYEIGFAADSESSVHVVIDDSGRLVSFNSKGKPALKVKQP